MGKFMDLTGQKYGRLTVIELDGKQGMYIKWLCKCECGNYISVVARSLRNGNTKSCGCISKERLNSLHNDNRKINTYKIAFGKCLLYSSFNNKFEIDVSNLEKIKNYCWSENRLGYACTTIVISRRKYKKIFLHRMIMNAEEGEIIDHIDRDFKNNKKSNLRKCTQRENMRNQSLSKRNTTGIIGVYTYKSNRWRVKLGLDGKDINLGLFDNKDDAIIARLKAEKEYFGEFAPQQHLFEQYGIA